MSPITPNQDQKRKRLATLGADSGAPAAKPEVAITDVTAVAVEEPVRRRAYVLVSVKTDAGITGFGEVSAGPDASSAVRRVLRHKEHLIGQDALAAEAVRRRLTQVVNGEASLLVAAVNIALLDILGKLSDAPLYEVLGGPTRDKARAMAHLHGASEPELTRSLRRANESGYRAFLVSLPEARGETRQPTFAARTRRLLEKLREVRDGVDFVLDCGGRLRPAEAAGLAHELEQFHLLWLEEPCAGVTGKGLRKISEETVVPLGLGRDVRHNREFQELLQEDAVDVLRPDVSRQGISGIRRAAALAETYYVAVAPFHRGGPIATAAGLHVAASIPNFFIQEVPTPADERDTRMRRELTSTAVESPRDGFLPLPTQPGLGVTLNEDAVERYRLRT